MLFSMTLLPPVVIDIFYQEDAGQAFFYSYLLLVTCNLFVQLRACLSCNALCNT